MSLDLKRKEVELMRVLTAKADMELRIYEREEEIKRLRDNIEIQEKTEQKLLTEINTIKET